MVLQTKLAEELEDLSVKCNFGSLVVDGNEDMELESEHVWIELPRDQYHVWMITWEMRC